MSLKRSTTSGCEKRIGISFVQEQVLVRSCTQYCLWGWLPVCRWWLAVWMHCLLRIFLRFIIRTTRSICLRQLRVLLYRRHHSRYRIRRIALLNHRSNFLHLHAIWTNAETWKVCHWLWLHRIPRQYGVRVSHVANPSPRKSACKHGLAYNSYWITKLFRRNGIVRTYMPQYSQVSHVLECLNGC